MLLDRLFTDPSSFIMLVAILLICLSWHEAAHALVARNLGDDTAESQGRLTLNPLAHIDPLGALAMLVAGVGWGRPVPVNPNNFAHPRLDNLKVALAGPLSNLLLALIFTALNLLFRPDPSSLAGIFTASIIWFNLMLMFFNLIPIPPLDGSKIVHLFLSDEAFYRFEQYGFYVLLGLIGLSWIGIPLLSTIIYTPTKLLFEVLTQFHLPSLF